MASFEWPIDKVSLINGCLAQTGDNLVTAADDGSDEWTVCSPAYERALGVVTEQHSWSWATDVRILQPAANVPDDDQFDTAYNLPVDLVHLLWVRVSDLPTIWGLLNGQLIVNSRGGPSGSTPTVPATTPAVVTVKGIFSTNSDIVHGTPTVVMAMEHFVFSAIYRGLHEDTANANAMMQAARQVLQEAMTRHDQQMPKRSMFNSRISASRRVRRPWPIVPGGWNGTGSPG